MQAMDDCFNVVITSRAVLVTRVFQVLEVSSEMLMELGFMVITGTLVCPTFCMQSSWLSTMGFG
jgi:hypothetical protein